MTDTKGRDLSIAASGLEVARIHGYPRSTSLRGVWPWSLQCLDFRLLDPEL